MAYQRNTPFTRVEAARHCFGGRSARSAILTFVAVVTAVTAVSPSARGQGTNGLIIIQGGSQTGATTRSLPVLFSVQTQANQTSGIPITFKVNSVAGAGGTFPGNANSIVVNTDPSGYAVPPLLVANGTPGSFTVTGSDPTGGSAVFNIITNQCVSTPQVSSNSNAPTVAGSLPYEVANACAGSTITFASGVTGSIAVSNRMRIDDNLTIQGPGSGSLAVDGGNSTRLFYVGSGNVNISGLTLQNGLAEGGPHACGGGAGGLGGALFVYNGSVALADTELISNQALGGSSQGRGFGNPTGGAGFGGAPLSGGQGGSGGDLGGFGGNGASAVDGAGGGGYSVSGATGQLAIPASGGAGGFGGGGGAAIGPNHQGGAGGFGAGGGAGVPDVLLGVAAANGVGGWGGGDGNNTILNGGFRGVGGGGAGFGGAVFLRSGSLALYGNIFTNNSAVGGTGGAGNDGQGKGGSLFILNNMTSSTANSNVAVDFGSTYAGSIAAAAGIGGIGGSDPVFANYVKGLPCPGADTADICGLVNDGTLQATAGTPQTVTFGATLSTLRATVQLPSNVPIAFLAGVPVTFTTPATGASATFAGSATSATVKTDATGLATAPALTANNTGGTYNVSASIGSLNVPFVITNIDLQSQTITFNSIATQVAGTTLTLSASASSGLPVTFTSLTTPVCTVSGATATLLATGMCTIQASQAGNSQYKAATSVTQSFTVSGASQTITFNSIANQVAGTTLTLSASASSGLPVTFTSLTTPVCTVSGVTLTLVTKGMCTIQASQAGNSQYAAATSVTQSFTVLGASQTITFNSIANQVAGTTLTLSASASSGLPITFTSLTTPVCTVSGVTLTLVTKDMCTIQASQAGNSQYAAATSVTRSFIVLGASQTITFNSIPNPLIGTTLTLSASASSGLAVTFTSLTTSVCTVSGVTLTLVTSGTCTIQASQAGNSQYAAATPVSQTFRVVRFAGTPGTPDCTDVSIPALAHTYGGLASAAKALGYASVAALQRAVAAYCGQ